MRQAGQTFGSLRILSRKRCQRRSTNACARKPEEMAARQKQFGFVEGMQSYSLVITSSRFSSRLATDA
jgi:hypothetical protein